MKFSSLEIVPADKAAASEMRARIDTLTKPVGSLGRIEELAVRLAAVAPLPQHGYRRRGILLGAADHGVAAEGVSAYPAEVTPQMVGAFLRGTAAVNAFARSAGAEVLVADFGVAADLPPHRDLLSLRVAPGTANLAHAPAMSLQQLESALDAGVTAAATLLERYGCEIVALGDMGIANTTSAAAIVGSFTQSPAAAVVGRGTGIDDERLARKRIIVDAAIARVAQLPAPARIAALGGFEIAGLAGAMALFAARRIPVILDGFIVTAAATIACALRPQIADALIASHASCEPGHRIALEALGLTPLFDLDLRLGEATGGALTFGFCDAAARMAGEMLTFEEAGVATQIDPPHAGQ